MDENNNYTNNDSNQQGNNQGQPSYSEPDYTQPDNTNQNYTQANYAQPNYSQPNYAQPNMIYTDPDKAVMTFGQWLITLLVLMIPCVNIIMLFVWAFGNGNENRKNYCRASLVMAAIIIVLYIIFFAVAGASMMSAYNAFNF